MENKALKIGLLVFVGLPVAALTIGVIVAKRKVKKQQQAIAAQSAASYAKFKAEAAAADQQSQAMFNAAAQRAAALNQSGNSVNVFNSSINK